MKNEKQSSQFYKTVKKYRRTPKETAFLQLPYADEMLLLTVPILEWDDPESIPKLDYNAKPSTNTLKSSALFFDSLFGGMESLDETWPSMMKELEQNIDKLVNTNNTNAFLKFLKGREPLIRV